MFGKRADEKLCGFDKKPCIKDRCVQWVHVYGMDPQNSNKHIDEADCALRWLPTLILETNKEVRHTCASMDVLRSDQQSASHVTHQMLANQSNGILSAFERLIQAARNYGVALDQRSLRDDDPHSQHMMLSEQRDDRQRKTG